MAIEGYTTINEMLSDDIVNRKRAIMPPVTWRQIIEAGIKTLEDKLKSPEADDGQKVHGN